MGLLKYPLFLFTLLPLLNCTKEASKKEDPIPAQMEAPPKTTSSGGFSGTVAETMTSGGYTYVQLETGIWLAGPQSDITKGESVHTDDAGSEMQDFVSKSLNRTFKSIYFVQAIHKGSHGTHEGTENPHAGMGSSDAESSQPEKTVIENLSVPAGGHSIHDIYAKKSDLVGKTVSLRAKVVKANFGIMNTNWYHLQDGTGLEGANDLTITSLSKAQLGNTVLVKGILTADKDFGQGYKYDLIIEAASVTIE